MSQLWRGIKGYIFWTYERGSVHYDVMVTLILLFIFVTPRFVNFKDQPAPGAPHLSGVTVTAEGNDLVYRVDASAVDAHSPASLQASLARVIEPISGKVRIIETGPLKDSSGHVVAYRAVVRK